MPDFSPTPRHRRDGHPVLALTGVVGVTAIAGLGVVLAVLPGQNPASPTGRPVAADLRLGRHQPLDARSRPAPGLPAAGPFYPPPHAAPRTSGDPAPERREETAEEAATRDGPERDRAAGERGALPPGHEAGAARSPGHETGAARSPERRPRAANPSSRSRPPSPPSPPSPISSARRGGGGSTGTAARSGTGEAHRPRPARMAPPDTPKPAARGSVTGDPAAGNTAGTNTAGKNTAAKDTVAKDTAARNSATPNSAARDTGARNAGVPRAEADGTTRARIQDPCLRFDDLRRDYCYEVLRRLAR
ncbi:hypothetical protein [Microbispora sp. NPDC046933]|uniref:hypothetical protein n=1 Tax=Microbispora sp. NPDC046933 TaxID=3155618 RepID=UPI0033CAC981